MDKFLRFLICLLCIKNISAVPPSPTDRLWEELLSAKSFITNIATQLETFNLSYLMKLEQQMNSISSTLSSIDSNIKNLQERAHVWDTFHLHVSAWNEQIINLDKKVEIISKDQENMDSKINFIEYTTEKIIGKLDDNLSNLQTITKVIGNKNYEPLLGKSTTRGVLRTLKRIERKLHKLQMSPSNSQSILYIAKQISDSKRSDDQEINNENSQESINGPILKFIRRLLKRLNQPCKREIQVLENLEVSIKSIDNTTITILEEEQSTHKDLLNHCLNNNNNDKQVSIKNSDVISKLDQVLLQIDNKFLAGQESISNYFTEQREHFSALLKSEFDKSCRIQYTVTTPKIESTEPYSNDTYVDKILKYSNKSNCEELDSSEPNGVYVLGDSEFKNVSTRSYNMRYCEQINNEFWTVIQRRGINPFQQKFNLTWAMYKDGFGSMNQDFWFGNDFIYNLSKEKRLILRVELEDFEGNTAWAEYHTFIVDSEENNYRLRISGYRGNASDSFSYHNNSFFSTSDRTNDQAPVCYPCAASYGGGWWFKR